MSRSHRSYRALDVARIAAIVALYLSCVFVCIPAKVVPEITVVRRPIRSVLRTVGLEQYWTMFVLSKVELVELRIVSVDANGIEHDSTRTFVKKSWPFRHVFDDPLLGLHYGLADGMFSKLLPAYASAIRRKLGGSVREIRFERAHNEDRTNTEEPIAQFSWQR